LEHGPQAPRLTELTEALERGGFVAASEEAEELLACPDPEAALARRLTGEPLVWITGGVDFCGRRVAVHPGVYVPRWHTELIAERALARMPAGGVAIDLCTGSGALAVVLGAVASDLDSRAVTCARANGVDAHEGDLFAPFPDLVADLVCGVVPYVPTPELPLLQRDTFAFETALAYDGGPDGTRLLQRAVTEARTHLHPGGALVLELGGDQLSALDLTGYTDVRPITDEFGDQRGFEATRS
jgi:release factor glutamine methyltransferase